MNNNLVEKPEIQKELHASVSFAEAEISLLERMEPGEARARCARRMFAAVNTLQKTLAQQRDAPPCEKIASELSELRDRAWLLF